MILPGTAQDGMLQDVGHAAVIGRRRAEADGKYLVIVIIRQIEKTGAAHLMLHEVRRRVYFFYKFFFTNAESAVLFTCFHCLCSFDVRKSVFHCTIFFVLKQKILQ